MDLFYYCLSHFGLGPVTRGSCKATGDGRRYCKTKGAHENNENNRTEDDPRAAAGQNGAAAGGTAGRDSPAHERAGRGNDPAAQTADDGSSFARLSVLRTSFSFIHRSSRACEGSSGGGLHSSGPIRPARSPWRYTGPSIIPKPSGQAKRAPPAVSSLLFIFSGSIRRRVCFLRFAWPFISIYHGRT